MLHVFQELYKAYTQHEKKYGDRGGIEDVIVSKRKFQYEEDSMTLCQPRKHMKENLWSYLTE